MKRVLVAAVLAALSVPPLARAEATLVTRDLPLAAARAPAATAPRFDLVGLHWRGPGTVLFRTRSVAGRWTSWQAAAPEAEDGPDRAGSERSRRGWRIGNPLWTGPSDAIQYRTRGVVRRLRAHFVRSPVSAAPGRTLALADAPPIVPRLSWGANESIRRAPPAYADSLQLGIVHHTARSNDYSRQESAAIVRAIQVYHVRGNGWNDIGYNFLVDKYGQVFEGRYGGYDRNVVGAHAEGFNTGSVGVAVLGNYDARAIPRPAEAALVSLLAWRLDVAHVDPVQLVSFLSRGNARFPAGIPVTLRTIVGHRDTGFTDCPGDRIYSRLGLIATAIAQTGLPKLYAPAVRGGIGAPVRFTGRLTAVLPWTVTVTDGGGATVAAGSGSGTAVDWTWDATLVPSGGYTYSIAAGPTVRPAAGTIGTRATLSLARLRAEPPTISPNGDGVDDTTTISYTLGVPATVTGMLVDASGAVLATLFSERKSAGDQSFLFTAEGVADGTYRIVLTAAAADRQVTASVDVIVSRVLSAFAADPAAFSPNGDGRLDRVRLSFALAEAADVRLRVLRAGKWVASPFAGTLQPGPQAVEWDGRKRAGRALDGEYEAELTVSTPVASVSQRLPLIVDTVAPALRIVSVRPLRLRVSEPAVVVVRVAGRRREIVRTRPGVLSVPLLSRPTRIRAFARDAAGNVSRPLRYG